MGSGQTKEKKVTIKQEAEDVAKKRARDDLKEDRGDRNDGYDSGQNSDAKGRNSGNRSDNNVESNRTSRNKNTGRSSYNNKSQTGSSDAGEGKRSPNQSARRGGPNSSNSLKGNSSKLAGYQGESNKLPSISENNYVSGDGHETNSSSHVEPKRDNRGDNSDGNGRRENGSPGRRGSGGSDSKRTEEKDEKEDKEDKEDKVNELNEDVENYDRHGEKRNRYQDEYDDDDDDDYNQRSSRTYRGPYNIEREKIETYLRSSRVPETKVRGLALRLSQVYSESESPKPVEWEKTERILRKIIHNGLDPIIHGSRKKTNLDRTEQDAEGLARTVSEMVHQLERDLGDCRAELEVQTTEDEDTSNHGNRWRSSSSPYKQQGGKGRQGHGRGNTTWRGQKGQKADDEKRENQKNIGKPTSVVIQNGIRELHTQYDILQDRYAELLKEKHKLERADASNRQKVDTYFQESKRLEGDLHKVGEDAVYLNETLGKVKSQEMKLRKNLKTVQEEKSQLESENKEITNTVRGLTRELNKLQDENEHLLADNSSLRGEVHKLQGPDKKTVGQVQELKQQVQELTAQTRKLEGEKGTLRGSYHKLEATLDAVQSEKKEIGRHRENLLRENRELETANKRLVLSGRDVREN